MAFVNLKEKEIQVKIDYSGPGRGGKTGNLENSHHKFASRINTEMVTFKTHGDRTLFLTSFPLVFYSSVVLVLKFKYIPFHAR